MKKVVLILLLISACGGSAAVEEPAEESTPVTEATQEITETTEASTTTVAPPTTMAPPTTASPNTTTAPAGSDSSSTNTTLNLPDGSISGITATEKKGVSPHLEKIDSNTFRMFYSSITEGGLAVEICDLKLNCTLQGVLDRIQDLTLVETVDGVRRGYFIEMNTSTMNKEVYTAVFSADGLTYSDKTSVGISSDGQMAWGVPDAVKLPDGRIRIYWVADAVGMAGEKIVSATSETTKGLVFTKDPGYRFENGYVDFEVLQANDNDWKAIMSFSPEKQPAIPQTLFYATSKDGLDWSFTASPMTPLNLSYLDPSGIVLDDGSYLIVSAYAPNAMGDRDYALSYMTLTTP